MAWKRIADGLRWEPLPHPNTVPIRQLLDALQDKDPRRARTVCGLLRASLDTGNFTDDLNRRLSKWCHWSHQQKQAMCREIGNLLFGRYPQPRFLDEQNNILPNTLELYQQWWQSVVAGKPAAAQQAAFHVQPPIAPDPRQHLVEAVDQFEEDMRVAIGNLRQRLGIANPQVPLEDDDVSQLLAELAGSHHDDESEDEPKPADVDFGKYFDEFFDEEDEDEVEIVDEENEDQIKGIDFDEDLLAELTLLEDNPPSDTHPPHIAWNRASAIDRFIEFCDQRYEEDHIQILPGRVNEIAAKYFAAFRQLDDAVARQVLGVMQQSIEAPPDARKRKQWQSALPQWKGCCVGFADYLLRPRDLDGINRADCAKALQRFSGWYHTESGRWGVFQVPAQRVGDAIFGPGVLRYLKIGEEWTFEQSRVDPTKVENGYMRVWRLAAGVPNAIRQQAKLDEETRTLASRLLCFMCVSNYTPTISHEDRLSLVAMFPGGDPRVLPPDKSDRDRHPLLRWSVQHQFVDVVTKRLKVRPEHWLAFLRTQGFDPDVTYNSDAERRLAWFNTWRIVPDA